MKHGMAELHGGPYGNNNLTIDWDPDANLIALREESGSVSVYRRGDSGGWHYEPRHACSMGGPCTCRIVDIPLFREFEESRSLGTPAGKTIAQQVEVLRSLQDQVFDRATAPIRAMMQRGAGFPELMRELDRIERVYRAADDIGVQLAKERIQKMKSLGKSNAEIEAEIQRLELELRLHRLQKMLDNAIEYDSKKIQYARPIV